MESSNEDTKLLKTPDIEDYNINQFVLSKKEKFFYGISEFCSKIIENMQSFYLNALDPPFPQI